MSDLVIAERQKLRAERDEARAENERLRAQLARVVDIAEATLARGDAEYGLGQIIAAAIVLPTRSE
jgi:hypothetical protein